MSGDDAASGATSPTAFPWDDAMAFGIGVLRLAPDAFWSLTPRELSALLPRRTDPSAPGRATLDAMMRRFPDAPAIRGGADQHPAATETGHGAA